MLIPEVLCPAGNMERLLTCLTYGADAVYVGGKEFSLRSKAVGFSWGELKQAIDLTHRRGKRLYFCLNIYPWQRDMYKIKEYVSMLAEYPIDALIVADPGVISMAKKIMPHIPLHLSTQANTSNSHSIKFWKEVGVERVNLARELNMGEIGQIMEEIRGEEIEIEVFVHGAMCMAISGRCYLSSYLNHRPANKGLCTHPCRFSYRVVGLALEEEQRPGKVLWEYLEEGDFSSFFAPEDLCLVKYLKWFRKRGITGLKIEGRMKTSSYLGPVVDVYSTALEDLKKNRFRLPLYLRELSMSSTRCATTGFFLGRKRKKVLSPRKQDSPVIARIVKGEGEKWEVEIKHPWNTLEEGIEILVPGLKRIGLSPEEYRFEDKNGKVLKEIHSGMRCYLRCPPGTVKENYLLRGKSTQLGKRI